MKHNSTWFIIVTYRPNRKILNRLLKPLEKRPVIVVNNEKKNLGYGGGANAGIQRAIDQGAQWIVVLNQDLEMTKKAVEELCEQLRGLAPGIAGPIAGSFDQKRWTTILPAHHRIDYISGSCMAIHRDVLKKVGNFYEPYFMYYEDADLCARATKYGFPLVQIPVDVRHKEGFNEYYLARNHLLFVERNAPIKVKIHEFLRLVKTFYEHRNHGNSAAEQGVRDYIMRKFGRRDE